MSNDNIQFKSLFFGWRYITRENAKIWAKNKLRSITMSKNDDNSMKIINSRLRGIQFTIEDLKNTNN